MDKNVLGILACPLCKGELIYDAKEEELICRFDRLAYPVIDEIPVMLPGRAKRLDEDE